MDKKLEHISDTLNVIKELIENLPDHNKNTEVVSEIRINEELKRLREEYETGLKIISHTNEIKWKIIAICSGVFSLFAIFVAPQQILKPYVKNYIDTNLTEPKLQEAANNITENKMEEFVTNKLKPLDSKIGSLTAYIDDIKHDITKKQKRINNKQVLLSELLKIQKLTNSCKAGTPDSYANYNELKILAGKKSSFQPFANAAIGDIFFYFDAEKNIKGRTLLETTTGKPIIYSVDEVIDIYYNENPVLNFPEAAINTLAILQRDTAVHDICDSIYKEQNLRVIARMIRALCILTDEYFETLDINKVKTWWENDTNKEKYKSYYKGLLEARALEKRPSFGSNENDYKQVVSLLKQTTKADTNALYSKCLLGYYYTLLKDFVNAKKEFDEVEPLGNNNYRWFFFYKAVFILLQENPDIDAAIASLNRAMQISPIFETIIKSSPVFKNLLENPQLKFPSNKK